MATMPLMALAQQKNISVDSVGTLERQLPEDVRFKIAELKVSGPLNGADLKLLGQIVTRTMLLESVWDFHFDPQTNVIDVHISRLREKLCAAHFGQILTKRGMGYQWVREEKVC